MHTPRLIRGLLLAGACICAATLAAAAATTAATMPATMALVQNGGEGSPDRRGDENLGYRCDLPEGYTQQELEACKMRERGRAVPGPRPKTDER